MSEVVTWGVLIGVKRLRRVLGVSVSGALIAGMGVFVRVKFFVVGCERFLLRLRMLM
ncbi:MAG: hypothetical protein ACUVT5_02955 [Candidatus Bathyarchaeales archaeon]